MIVSIEQLRQLLAPFAAVADCYDDAEDDGFDPARDYGMSKGVAVTLDQFRAVRTFLAQQLKQNDAGDESTTAGKDSFAAKLNSITELMLRASNSALESSLRANDSLKAERATQYELLELARQFVVNGLENGYILLPDLNTPDPAHELLPKIEAALRKGSTDEAAVPASDAGAVLNVSALRESMETAAGRGKPAEMIVGAIHLRVRYQGLKWVHEQLEDGDWHALGIDEFDDLLRTALTAQS